MINFDAIIQGCIFILTCSSIGLISYGKPKWGTFLGILASPFWLISSIPNQQWGIVASTTLITLMYIYGFWNWGWGPASKK